MKHKLQKIKEESQELCAEISSDLRTSQKHLGQIGDEYHRVTALSGQAARIVDQIDADFKEKTKLSNLDITILFLATAIQCTRQYLLSNDKLRLTANQGDLLMENTVGKLVPPSLNDVRPCFLGDPGCDLFQLRLGEAIPHQKTEQIADAAVIDVRVRACHEILGRGLLRRLNEIVDLLNSSAGAETAYDSYLPCRL